MSEQFNQWFPLTLLFSSLLLLCGCEVDDSPSMQTLLRKNRVKSEIRRQHDEKLFELPEPVFHAAPTYPWHQQMTGKHPKITKHFFRCQGSRKNPPQQMTNSEGETVELVDCSGTVSHSLPFDEEDETIYPILIDLLNWIQAQTDHRVVITSGHRCPTHNSYVDPSPANQTSKHLIGAEVSFYVEGMESRPEEVIELIQTFYLHDSLAEQTPSLRSFQRYTQGSTNVSTPPWYNKEVFVKLFHSSEGRNGDNQHSNPYISIQVRWDREKDERVSYTWKQAHLGYVKWTMR